jgi:hypothetical protein
MAEWSSCSFETLYDPTNAIQGQLLSDGIAAPPPRNFRALLRDSITGALVETWSFLGHIEEIGLGEINVEGARILSGTIAMDGAVTIT